LYETYSFGKKYRSTNYDVQAEKHFTLCLDIINSCDSVGLVGRLVGWLVGGQQVSTLIENL
jgi:hypothetical protein